MNKFGVLVARELWEHHNLWRVPLIILVLVLLANLGFFRGSFLARPGAAGYVLPDRRYNVRVRGVDRVFRVLFSGVVLPG